MHSPTLISILMVERTIQKYDGEQGKYQLWKRLPKKMMYQTFQVILEYLENSNKISYIGNKIHWEHPEIEIAKRVRPEQIHYVM